MFLTLILVSASLITGGPSQQSAPPPRSEMLKLFHENARMREESGRLAAQVEATDRKISAAKDAIANLAYTRAENQKYLDSLAAQTDGKRENK